MQSLRRPSYQTTLVLIVLTSWLFMLVSSTCAMPMPRQIPVAKTMPVGCSDANHHTPDAQLSQPNQDCVLKACPDSQPNPAFNFKIDKPDVAVLILCLTWLIGAILSPRRLHLIPHRHRPPFADPIPIRYRFCTLLN